MFAPFGMKEGDQKLRVRQIVSEPKTLSTASQEGSDYEISNLGDVVGLRVSVNVVATGTLTGAQKLRAAIKEIKLKDKAGRTIWDGIGGGDLNFLQHLTNAAGKKITETDVSTTAATDIYEIPVSIDVKDLPAKVHVTYNPYSSLATSGATGGSATVEIAAYHRDGTTTSTFRCKKITKDLASGTNNLTADLPRGVIVNKIGLNATESSLTSVVVSSDGGEEIDMKTADITAFLDGMRADAHISNYNIVPCAPFTSTDRAVFKITTSASISGAGIYFFTLE